MKTYYITTDSGSQKIQANNINEALKQWGEAPPSVTSPKTFEAWLERLGGYGSITEDDIRIASVAR